jgi:hypothetical protein
VIDKPESTPQRLGVGILLRFRFGGNRTFVADTFPW